MAKKFLCFSALALAIALLLPASALASTEAWDFASVGTSFNNGLGYALGEVFVPTQNMSVDFLGYYGSVGGFAESHQVGLYNANGILLSSTTIDNSSSAFANHFVFNSVTAFELLAGQTYVIVGTSGVIDPYAFNDGGFTVFAPANVIGDNFIQTGGSLLLFTGTTCNCDVSDGYWGANFGWNLTTTTPEPSSLLLLGSGVFGVAGLLRRKLF